MKRFKLKRPDRQNEHEKTFILLDDQKCGFVEKDTKDIYHISLAISYENQPGFRFVKVDKPSFPSENQCLEYLNENHVAICGLQLHFFDEI